MGITKTIMWQQDIDGVVQLNAFMWDYKDCALKKEDGEKRRKRAFA